MWHPIFEVIRWGKFPFGYKILVTERYKSQELNDTCKSPLHHSNITFEAKRKTKTLSFWETIVTNDWPILHHRTDVETTPTVSCPVMVFCDEIDFSHSGSVLYEFCKVLSPSCQTSLPCMSISRLTLWTWILLHCLNSRLSRILGSTSICKTCFV